MTYDLLRFMAAFLSGGLLSLSGSLVQGVTQNELAGPSTLGFNAYVVLIILASHGISLVFNLPWPLELVSFFIFLVLTGLAQFCLRGKWKAPAKYSNRVSSNIPFFILLGLCFNLFAGRCFPICNSFL